MEPFNRKDVKIDGEILQHPMCLPIHHTKWAVDVFHSIVLKKEQGLELDNSMMSTATNDL
jgi:hypothetical protein